MKTYTVLLHYPLSVSEGGVETFTAVVEALGPCSAIIVAKEKAVKFQGDDAECDHPDDFTPLYIFEGDITPFMELKGDEI